MRAQLFTIEGTDGSGKATQVNELYNRLTNLGLKVKVFSYPRYETLIGKEIAKFLNGEIQLSPKSLALLYAADRLATKEEMLNCLNNDTIVLCDRYVTSNIPYMTLRVPKEERKELSLWLYRLEFEDFGMPIPDLQIFLDLPYDTKNIVSKGERQYTEGLDRNERDINFQQKVRDEYLSIFSELQDLDEGLIINCAADNGDRYSVDNIATKILNNVLELI